MTKLMIEKIMDDYDRAYGLKSVRLRYFNVAGADSKTRVGEWHNPESHLIPNVLKSTFSGGKTFKMFGDDYKTKDGTCVRDYINVEDLAQAHLLALNYLSNGGETNFFNLGTGDGNTVKEVFAACEKVTDKKIPVEICSRRAGDPASLVADNTKVKKILGWQPTKTLEYSIKTAYNWEKTLQG
jgi:UDP-glucose 4-epimerase